MPVYLRDYVEPLKREVQPPGADIFPGVTEQQWVGYLADAFWEARLDGFLQGYEVVESTPGDVNAEVVPTTSGAADLPRQDIALIVLYAGIRVLRNRILNMNTAFRAKAGPVEFEQENSATMLAEMLKQLKSTKDRILEALDDVGGTGVVVLDAYSTRVFDSTSYHGGIELTG